MNTANKNAILDVLRTGSALDRLGLIINEGFGPKIDSSVNWGAVTWSAASGGLLTNSAAVDFENTSGSTISVLGIVLVKSTITSPSAVEDAIAYDYFGATVNVANGEVLRIDTATYTIN